MKKINITIALLMSISIFTNAQKRVTMRIDTAKPIHLLIKTISVMKQNVMGQEMEIKSDVSLDIDLEMFIRPKAASTMYSQTIKRVQIKSEVMGNSIEFDSDNKEDRENPIGQKIALLLDKPQKTNIKSIPSINSSTAAQDETQELLGDLDDLNKEVIYKISDTIKSNHTFINIVLLDNDTTDSDIDIFNENKNDLIKSKITYIVKSINDNYATLAFNGIVNNKKTKNVQGMEAIVTMRSTVNGELLVDINTGIIKEKKTETTATGSTELMGQKIPFTLISTTTSFTK